MALSIMQNPGYAVRLMALVFVASIHPFEASYGDAALHLGQPMLPASGEPKGLPSGQAIVDPRFSSPYLSAGRMTNLLDNIGPDTALLTRGGSGARIFQSVAPAVVLIATESSLGTGILVNSEGEVVTNWHVIEGYQSVGVIFKPGQDRDTLTEADIRRAEVIKIDEVADLALLRVIAPLGDRTPVAFGVLDQVLIGANVHAIGHPQGESWTYTRGFISQFRRAYEWQTASGVKHRADVIQTQTPINPGNSGGPLLNESGQLIGVNSFKADGEGLNFAVSIDEVRTFLARPVSRTALRSPARGSVAVQCDTEVVASDTQVLAGDPGMMFWLDADCDGQPDFQMFIPIDEEQPIAIFLDNRQDGSIDTILLDVNRDGAIDLSLMDSNGDGKADLRGYHRNGDLEPYRVERIL